MRLSTFFGTDKRPYQKLEPIFAAVKTLRDRNEVLTAHQWGAADESDIRALTELKIQNKVDEWDILSEIEVWSLLEEAGKNKNALKKWEKKNLEDMIAVHAMVTSTPTADAVKERLRFFAAGEQAFARVQDEFSDNRAALWEAQKPLLKGAFITMWNDLKPAAAKLEMSPYEVAMIQYMPHKTDKDIKEYLSAVEKQYPAIVQAMMKDGAREEALPIPTFPELCEGKSDEQIATLEAQYAAFMEEVQQSFLEAAGWGAEELDQNGIRITRKISEYGGYCWGNPQNMTVAIGLKDEPCIINTAVKTLFHETGHLLAMLELNRMKPEQRDQLVGQINGMGLHETFALYFEEMAKSKKGSEIIAGLAHKHFGVEGVEWSAENIYKHSNPPANTPEAVMGLIDASSDLAAMPASYAWRVKIEQDILNSESHEEIEAKIDALPETWANTMEKITGLKDQYNSDDFAIDESHWFVGMPGYFPAYAESAKNASALRDHHKNYDGIEFNRSAAKDLKSFLEPSVALMREELMVKGSTQKPDDLMRKAVGYRPTFTEFLEGLKGKHQNDIDFTPEHPVRAPSFSA